MIRVDAHDEHGGISRGGRDDDLLGTSLDVGVGLLDGGEDAGGLADVVGADLTPADLGGVHLGEELDALSVDDEAVSVDLDGGIELAVNGVVLELVGGVLCWGGKVEEEGLRSASFK